MGMHIYQIFSNSNLTHTDREHQQACVPQGCLESNMTILEDLFLIYLSFKKFPIIMMPKDSPKIKVT